MRNGESRSSNAEMRRKRDARPMALNYHWDFFADCRAFQSDVLRVVGAELLSDKLPTLMRGDHSSTTLAPYMAAKVGASESTRERPLNNSYDGQQVQTNPILNR